MFSLLHCLQCRVCSLFLSSPVPELCIMSCVFTSPGHCCPTTYIFFPFYGILSDPYIFFQKRYLLQLWLCCSKCRANHLQSPDQIRKFLSLLNQAKQICRQVNKSSDRAGLISPSPEALQTSSITNGSAV